MTRFLAAFVWFRWRVMANGLKGGRSRDTVERLARVFALILPGVIWLIFLLASAVTAVAGLLIGFFAAEGSLAPRGALIGPRILLAMVTAAVVLVPLGRSIHGVSSSMTRFLLLPVRRSTLHTVEVMSGLSDPWLAFVVPGLATFPMGLLAGGLPGAAFWAAVMGAGFLAVLAAVASLLTFLVHWVLRDRRRAENTAIAAIAAVVVLSTGGALTALLTGPRENGRSPGSVNLDLREESLPRWIGMVPSEIYGRTLERAVEGRPARAAIGTAGLWIQAALCFGLSSMVHRRTLEMPETGRSRRRRGRARAWREIPGLSPAAGAVASAQARSWMRTVRVRLAVFLSGPMLLIVGLTIGRLIDQLPVGGIAGGGGTLLLTAGSLLSLLGLQPILLNQFATDRAGLTLQFLSPITGRDVVRGKAVAGAVLFGLCMILCLAASLILAPGGPVLGWISTLLAACSLYILMAPFSAIISAVFPRAADLGKVGSAGNAHTAAGLIGIILILPLAAPPGIIVLIAGSLLGMPALALGLMVLWTCVAFVAGTVLLDVAGRLVDARRENLALVAQER